MISGISSATGAANKSANGTATDAQSMQDQFLTLLVAQLKNQDPTNPMDNAQMTSQMAQISTVSGIEKLNDTVSSVTNQFAQMQMLQGASLIGHTVLSSGNSLATTKDGQSTAAFDLASNAAQVSVTITNAAGQLVDTVDLGSLNAGRNYFTWDSSSYTGDPTQLRYAVTAKNADSAVNVSHMSANSVVAASVTNGKLMLELGDGTSVDYSSVQSVF